MKKILLLLLIAGLFSQEEKRSGFGFTFDGGNTIMNLLSGSVLSGGSTISLTPTLYLIENLPFGKVEPSISYYYKKFTETEIWTGKKPKEANSVTIFLDACFTGQTREENLLVADARPITIVPIVGSVSDSMSILTATSSSQTSGAIKEQKHGLFTYFLLKGLRGDADTDENKKLTLFELSKYIKQLIVKTD